MLDIDMLDQLARPFGGGIYTLTEVGRPKPLCLNEIFARVSSNGWNPRNPAPESELSRLERSLASGTCLNPLLLDSDEIYIDHDAHPVPGDIVAFRLSRRGCEAQNSDLPAGQSPWNPGDRWAKLFVDYHGTQMLLDRHGRSATATLMACENPNDTPILHPVRNIRRDGRLLFGSHPNTFHCTDIAVNGATDIIWTSVPSYSGSVISDSIASIAVSAKSVAYTATVTASGDLWKTLGASAVCYLAQLSGGVPSGVTSQPFNVVATASPGTRVAIVFAFSVPASTATTFALWYSSGTVGNFGLAANVDLRVDIIKR